ncbi:MAG: threonylcarbamoyl-AMP synthase [Deinococcales bacterium]|nr:threonylcarbamoyl-AMP synthase [Chitinophagaceae bacterium]
MQNFLQDIDACLTVLQNGGIILYPTDTVWGIGCDATNEAAVKKIYDLKQRVETNKMIVLVATEKDVMQHVSQLDLEVFGYLSTVAKPTTIIYDGAIGLADNIISADGSIAIRLCNDAFCKHLLKRFQKPIVSTSANISGKPTPQNFNEISFPIVQGVDYVVKHRQNDLTPSTPSAIIKWGKNGSITVIRA